MTNHKPILTWIAFVILLCSQVSLIFLPFLPQTTALLDSLITEADPTQPHTFANIYLSTVGIHASLMMIFLGFAFAALRKDSKTHESNLERAMGSQSLIQPLRDDEFYDNFQLAAKRALSKVFISYLDPHPPVAFNRDRARYYRDLISIIKNNPTAQYRRIIRFTEANREWLLDLTDKLAGYPNASIAFLADSDEELMPLSLSTQIVDTQDTWLVAIESHERTDTYRDLHIRDSVFCRMMSLYYDRLWGKSTVLLDCGTIHKASLPVLPDGKEST